MDSSSTATDQPSRARQASKLEAVEQSAEVASQESVQLGPPEKRLKTNDPNRATDSSAPDATTPSTVASAPSDRFPLPGDETPRTGDDVASSSAFAQPFSKYPLNVNERAPAHSESESSFLSPSSSVVADDRHSYRYDTKEDLQERATYGNKGSQRSMSPDPAFQLPPAPPSTPASQPSVALPFCFEGLADFVGPPSLTTPSAQMLRGDGYVKNAALLEQQQQRLLEGGVTPAPSRHAAAAAPTTASSAALLAATPTVAAAAAAGAATPKPGGTPASIPLPEDFSDWAVGDRYELVRILGRGSYGEVAQAIDLHKTAAAGGEETLFVAIKRILSPFEQQLDAVRLYREIHILRRMKQGGDDALDSSRTMSEMRRHHDCIIQLLDVVQPSALEDFNDLYLVFECTFSFALPLT